MEELTRVARHYNQLVLWRSSGGVNCYTVEERGTVYAYEPKLVTDAS
ncbi:MAG: hypothetical protein HY261_05145 [Chloroflexi bacterium]|nr:hypothetical protein [Chloroflexota bacterium]